MKEPQYTHEEIERLVEILSGTRLLRNAGYVSDKNMPVDTRLKEVFGNMYPLGDYLVIKILNIAYMPLENVPLYVGQRSEALEALVKWRLEIGK